MRRRRNTGAERERGDGALTLRAAIVSDLHLGSAHCRHRAFASFVRALPAGTTLVMNGDTVHRWHSGLPEEHVEVLELLRAESATRRIVWLHGNHDESYDLEEPGSIEVAASFAMGKRLFAAHGYDFDNVMPRNRTFIYTFRLLHRLRVWLGAESVHVALYAKKFPLLYRVLRRSVMMNAVEYAKENGFEAVTCGHTHYAEDTVVEGIRYINTGSWTEEPMYFLGVTDEEMKLMRVDALPGVSGDKQ
ncbi:UDP-2,3-diacylglucosamine diphosphatase [Verrucomicrobiota bacterium]